MQYGITKQVVENLDKRLLIMHPGPINRGVEISSDIADSEHAIILDQVENGVAVRMAILYLLASKIEQWHLRVKKIPPLSLMKIQI